MKVLQNEKQKQGKLKEPPQKVQKKESDFSLLLVQFQFFFLEICNPSAYNKKLELFKKKIFKIEKSEKLSHKNAIKSLNLGVLG